MFQKIVYNYINDNCITRTLRPASLIAENGYGLGLELIQMAVVDKRVNEKNGKKKQI